MVQPDKHGIGCGVHLEEIEAVDIQAAQRQCSRIFHDHWDGEEETLGPLTLYPLTGALKVKVTDLRKASLLQHKIDNGRKLSEKETVQRERLKELYGEPA